MLTEFLYATQFLTRLPVPSSDESPDAAIQGRSVLFYPLVGLLIGGVLVSVHLLLPTGSTGIQAALLLALWVAITGGVHLDGLADLADAWVGGHGDRGRTLEIMKDPQSGPMAVTALVLLLLLKFTALEMLVTHGAWSVLLLVPMIGRAGLVAGLLYLPYVRSGGLGEILAKQLPRDRAQVVLFVCALTLFLFWAWDALWVLIPVTACFALIRKGLMDRLGGITGDAAGALCELLELTALLTLAMLL